MEIWKDIKKYEGKYKIRIFRIKEVLKWHRKKKRK